MSADPAEISPDEAYAALRAGACLIDVRTPEEWEAGRIPGAVHITLTELSTRAQEIPRDQTVIFSCLAGTRSKMAADAFRGGGLDARSLAGGATAWVAGGLPFDGVVADH